MSERLVIIDGKSVFYRGYYAMPNLTTKDGTPTGGVYGFAVMALEIIKRLRPEYVCVAWDKAGTNTRSRRALYPPYKGNRKPPPPDFYEQIPILHDMLESLGWPLYEADDYEADDLMGAFAKQVGPKGVESFLITSDLDVLQLVNEHTHIYTIKKGLSNIELFDVEHFEEKYGVSANQWADVKALKGDASDNIPGVAGVGEKTALQLIKDYKTLDNVYAHLDDIKPTLRAKLEKDKDMAYLSQKLVTLMVDAPTQIDLEHARLEPTVTPEFVAMLRKLEFRNLLHKVEGDVPKEEVAQASLILEEEAIEPAELVNFNPSDYSGAEPRIIAVDPEKTTLWVSAGVGKVSTLPLADLDADLVSTLAGGPVIGHDLKTVFGTLLAQNITWPGQIGHDTRIGAFLLNSLIRSRELADIVEHPVDLSQPGQVVAGIWQAYEDQRLQFDEAPTIDTLAREIEFPTIMLLAHVEARGILLDSGYLNTMSEDFAKQISALEQEIYQHAGQEFTIGSPQQLGTILFEKIGLPTQGIKKGKTGYSTGASELDKLRHLHPIADLVSRWREYTKLKSTYIDALPKLVDADGRLHTTYTLDVAATGRLSSHDPNLQNIPTRTEMGQAIRTAFVPAPGNVFVSADYSQFELRLAAVMAGDQKLIDDFNADIDIHTATAAEVYGVPLEQVTKDMRRHAKTVNFGVLYGMSPHGLSVATGMTRDAAKDFIEKYFQLRAPIRTYMDNVVKVALEDGYVATLFGRRRPTPDLKSSNFIARESAKRAAINMPIQGTEADLMKMAMLHIEKNLGDLGQQILQVHDSVLVECPSAHAQKVADILRETMEHVYKLPVKLAVDVSTGKNWGEL
ncbi:MAG: DNA polymerase I [Candidatus Saccharibacteria bacterium]